MQRGCCSLHGGSLRDNFVTRRIKAIIQGPSTKPSSRLQKFLDAHPQQIVKMQVGRQPVNSLVTGALNTVSLGAFKRKQKDLNYDQIYHNFILVTLSDGRTFRLEKNQTVSERPARDSDFAHQLFDIPMTKSLTMKQVMENAARDNESQLYKFRAGSNNCQQFTADIVTRNGLLPADAKALERQNSKALVETLPGGDAIPNGITDAAAVAQRLIHGDGIKSRKSFLCPL